VAHPPGPRSHELTSHERKHIQWITAVPTNALNDTAVQRKNLTADAAPVDMLLPADSIDKSRHNRTAITLDKALYGQS
jgi:desulfoferrodoxin (superoxide reductase-like protein)